MIRRFAIAAVLTLCAPLSGVAVESEEWRAIQPLPDWSLHAQTTLIGQGYPAFRSPYEGGNSLGGNAQARETWTVTGYAGRSLWQGAATPRRIRFRDTKPLPL